MAGFISSLAGFNSQPFSCPIMLPISQIIIKSLSLLFFGINWHKLLNSEKCGFFYFLNGRSHTYFPEEFLHSCDIHNLSCVNYFCCFFCLVRYLRICFKFAFDDKLFSLPRFNWDQRARWKFHLRKANKWWSLNIEYLINYFFELHIWFWHSKLKWL